MEGCFNLWLCLVVDPVLISGLFFGILSTTTALLVVPWVISLFIVFPGGLLVSLILFSLGVYQSAYFYSDIFWGFI